MIKITVCTLTLLFTAVAISVAQTPDKAALEAKEKAAWQAFKDKSEDGFKKVVDKDLRAIYPEGVMKLQDELNAMKKWDMKSFEITDFDMFSDEKDVVVTTYKVKIDGTFDGNDMSGSYNAGTVWKLENGEWMGIFHTNIMAENPGE